MIVEESARYEIPLLYWLRRSFSRMRYRKKNAKNRSHSIMDFNQFISSCGNP
jgi:hypothetical protein